MTTKARARKNPALPKLDTATLRAHAEDNFRDPYLLWVGEKERGWEAEGSENPLQRNPRGYGAREEDRGSFPVHERKIIRLSCEQEGDTSVRIRDLGNAGFTKYEEVCCLFPSSMGFWGW